ncbi:hypothetical protein RYX36_028993 [Vicia faba]
MRKQKQIEYLTEEACRLKNKNDRLKQNIKAAEDAYAEIDETNSVVRAQTMELLDRLLFIKSIVENAEDANGQSNDIALFRNPLLKLCFIPH